MRSRNSSQVSRKSTDAETPLTIHEWSDSTVRGSSLLFGELLTEMAAPRDFLKTRSTRIDYHRQSHQPNNGGLLKRPTSIARNA